MATYAFASAQARSRPSVVDVQVPIDDLHPSLVGFTIAQISDVHIGESLRRPCLEGVVAAVNGTGAHLVAITGDLVDGSVEDLREHTAPLLDHDGGAVIVGGVTDHMMGASIGGHASDPHAAIAGAPPDAFKLLLAHQPASSKAAAQAGFDLQLSGHTHGGQFFPGTLLAHLMYPFVAGLGRLDTLWVYVNRGTGWVGPALRTTRHPCEVTRLTLVLAGARASTTKDT